MEFAADEQPKPRGVLVLEVGERPEEADVPRELCHARFGVRAGLRRLEVSSLIKLSVETTWLHSPTMDGRFFYSTD